MCIRDSSVTLCDAGSYRGATGGTSQADCAACGAGYACAKGVVERAACEPGTSSSDGIACVGCAAGAYQPSTAQSSCVACPAGSYCLARSSGSIAGAPGQFSAGDSASTCDDCAAGEYQSSSSATACEACDAGGWCGAGASAATLCAAGSYRGATGATAAEACVACDEGHFCPNTTAQLACDAGMLCLGDAQRHEQRWRCPPGHFCDPGGAHAARPRTAWWRCSGTARSSRGWVCSACSRAAAPICRSTRSGRRIGGSSWSRTPPVLRCWRRASTPRVCLLYTSDAADE